MGGIIYDMAELVFGSGLADELVDWLEKLLGTVDGVLSSANGLITVFTEIAALLMIVYFFQDLLNQASRDMFSFEKLIVAFIRLLIAFTVMMYLPNILDLLVDLASGFVTEVKNTTFSGTEISTSTTGTRDAYIDYFKKLTKILEAIGCVLGLLIPWVLAQAAKLIATFVITSSAVMLVVRAIFSPLGVCQLFEEGSRSSGMRYLKGLLAEALSFSVIVAIMLVANSFSNQMAALGGAANELPEPGQLNEHLGFTGLFYAIIGKLIIAGGMASGSKIAHDVLGA